MLKRTQTIATATDETADACALSRRSLLRLGLTGGAMLMGMPAFAAGDGKDGAPVAGGTLTIGADADPIGLDPTVVTAFSSADFIALIYSGLLRWNAKMEIEPDLAVSYEMPDEKTYIFKLRQGVKFHNGQDFTAEDVKYTFDRILDPATASHLRAQYSTVTAVTVVDPYTVKFELESADAAFLNYLATADDGAIVPKGVENLMTDPVGTGPFIFGSYQPNQQFTLNANPDYYEEGLPLLSTVVFRFYKDQSTLSSALRSKAIDMTWLKDPKVAALMSRTSPQLVSAPGQTSRTFPIWMNLKAAPFDDVRVRRALSLATDREACVQTVLSGSGKVGAMLPESHVGGYDGTGEMPYYKHDPEAAKKLLAEAGYPDGIDLGEYIVVAANALDVACAQILQQQWQAAGITVKLMPMETAPLLNHWSSGTWPTLLSVALSWTPDADAIFQYLVSDSKFGKAVGVSDDKLDAMIAEARSEVDTEKRAARNMEIQKHIAENAYILQVYQYPLRWEIWWDSIKGYEPLAANVRSFVRTAWRDE
ncbi:ABC transporter substrate-binding protein [Nitratireductor pacificus]|uniref:ABC transporter periplasmic protein n=1 Tax=Nitratireductor pacificus pht-3B TaxID=391937 RepID=K2MCJ4_9HYPH|nr:ABC transporter substrate-binding protein [Nitratireductor pacificus]EKF18505.1 ABC transporter periplasmic protein [Nitratireductor pacificus pht-3B]